MPSADDARRAVAASRVDQVIDFALRLIATPSPNPNGNTCAIAETAAAILGAIPGVEVEMLPGSVADSSVLSSWWPSVRQGGFLSQAAPARAG